MQMKIEKTKRVKEVIVAKKPMKSHIIRGNYDNKSQIISLLLFLPLSTLLSLPISRLSSLNFNSFNFANSCAVAVEPNASANSMQTQKVRKVFASIRKFDNWLKIAANILNYHVRVIVIIFNFAFFAQPSHRRSFTKQTDFQF